MSITQKLFWGVLGAFLAWMWLKHDHPRPRRRQQTTPGRTPTTPPADEPVTPPGRGCA